MPYDLSKPLVIGISSRALFNLEQENKIFEEQGVEAYEAYQVAHENEILQKGAAFQLIKAFFLGGVSKTEVLAAFGTHIFLMIRIYIQSQLRRLFRRPQCLIGMEIIRKSKTLYRAKSHL